MKKIIVSIVLVIAAAAFIYYHETKDSEPETIAKLEANLAHKKDQLKNQRKLLREKKEVLENLHGDVSTMKATLGGIWSDFVNTCSLVESSTLTLAERESELNEVFVQSGITLRRLKPLVEISHPRKEGLYQTIVDFIHRQQAEIIFEQYKILNDSIKPKTEEVRAEKARLNALKVKQAALRDLIKKTLQREMPEQEMEELSDTDLAALAATSKTPLDVRENLAYEILLIEAENAKLEREIKVAEKELLLEKSRAGLTH